MRPKDHLWSKTINESGSSQQEAWQALNSTIMKTLAKEIGFSNQDA